AREANDDAKEKCNTEKEAVKETLQQIIQANESMAAIKIKNVRKLARDIVRVRCHTESDATQLRQLNWEEMLGGVTATKAEYGIVVHGVPKQLVEDMGELMENIERANEIKVKRITPL